MNKRLAEFITKVPKTDLHVHLDGSLRISSIIELCKQSKIKLPSYTVEGLNKLVFKDHYKSLVEYLRGFDYIIPVMQTAENLERISYEFAMDNINEGVYYAEPKFAPQLHINPQLNVEKILISVNKGLKRAQSEYNNRAEVKSGKRPEFNYGIIVCAFRFFAKGMSHFLDTFLDVHQYSKPKCIYSMAAFELVAASIKARDKYDLPIVALDLVGAEYGNPPHYFKDAYQLAQENLLRLIVHAGEAYGPESIYYALTELNPERIGHGTTLFSKNLIADSSVKDKEAYIHKLVNYIAARRITIEVCLTSNLQTDPSIKKIANHSFDKMLKANLSTTICTDNRTFSKTSVTREILLAIENFDIQSDTLREIILCGFDKGFYPGSAANKKKIMQDVNKRYTKLAEQYSDVI
jgi:adenosine deaminase